MPSTDTNLNRWAQRDLTPELRESISTITSRFSTDRNITIAGRNNVEDIVERLLDNPKVDDRFLIALNVFSKIPPNKFDGSPNTPSITAQIYPDYASYEGHKKAVDLMHILTGIPKDIISSEYPGLGFTGTEDEGIEQGIGVASNFPQFLNETVLHDVLVTLAEDFPEFFEGLDGAVYGTNNKARSAVYIALDSLTLNLTKAIRDGDLSVLLPEEEEFLNFVGINEAPKQDILLFNTVTNLGKTASTIGAKIAIHYGDEGLANQLINQAAAQTLGGFIGDKLVFENFTIKGSPSLEIRDLYTRFYGEYFRTLINLGTDAIDTALFDAFDIDDPLSQLGIGTISSTLVYNTYGSLITNTFGSEFPVQYLGLDPTRNYDLSLAAIKGDFIQNAVGGIQNFLGSQLFSLVDEAWSDANLTNLGSSIGGSIGSLILPGIGTFAGQVIGGFIWDLIDNPEAFYSVTLDLEQNGFTHEFAYENDGGEVAIAEQMARSAQETLNLLTGMIGGEAIAAAPYLYGLKEDQFQYRHQNITSFEEIQPAITEGIVSQLKTVEIDGGDPYMKYFISLPEYVPSLETLFADLGVAQEYSDHKNDPFLYGQTILNIEDEEIRNYLLEDWNRIRERAAEIGLYDAPFNDKGEFIPDTIGNDIIDAGDGDDFLYSQGGRDRLSGGDGDDTIQASLLSQGSNFQGGEGQDTLVVNFSDYIVEDLDDSNLRYNGVSIRHNPNSFGSDYVWTSQGHFFGYNGIENINAVGSIYNDEFRSDAKNNIVDAGEGVDSLYLDWRNATDQIEVDLTNPEDQAFYGKTKLSNFESIDYIITGGEADRFKLDYSTLLASYTNFSGNAKINGGGGEDTLFWDLSNYSPEDFETTTGSLEGLTINHNPNAFGSEYITNSDGILFGHSNVEKINVVGTNYNDELKTDSNSTVFDAGKGLDSLYLDWRNADSSIEIDLTGNENQAIYGSTSLKNFDIIDYIFTGSGDDLINLDYAVLKESYSSSDWGSVLTGEGYDILSLDLSDYNPDDFTGTLGSREGLKIGHNPFSPGRDYISSSHGLLFGYNNVEKIEIIGTTYNDQLETRSNEVIFDAGEGIDSLNLYWREAFSDITIDLTQKANQVDYGDADLSNFDAINYVQTGDGNDTFKLDYFAIKNSHTEHTNGRIVAGDGTDTIYLDLSEYNPDDFEATAGTSEGLSIDNYPGSYQNVTHSGTTLLRYGGVGSIELVNVIGTEYDDVLKDGLRDHDAGATVFDGNDGNDQLLGGNGDDILIGGNGNDILEGGDGNDQLLGGLGNDIINGEAGDDILTGGLGEDSFILSNDGSDIITDFNVDEDIILLEGNLTFGQLSLTSSGGNLLINVNGALLVTVSGISSLNSNSFEAL